MVRHGVGGSGDSVPGSYNMGGGGMLNTIMWGRGDMLGTYLLGRGGMLYLNLWGRSGMPGNI